MAGRRRLARFCLPRGDAARRWRAGFASARASWRGSGACSTSTRKRRLSDIMPQAAGPRASAGSLRPQTCYSVTIVYFPVKFPPNLTGGRPKKLTWTSGLPQMHPNVQPRRLSQATSSEERPTPRGRHAGSLTRADTVRHTTSYQRAPCASPKLALGPSYHQILQ